MHVAATDTRRLAAMCTPREINKRNITNLHLARPRKAPVVPAVLRDSDPDVRPIEMEVLEADVVDDAPATAAREACALVR